MLNYVALGVGHAWVHGQRWLVAVGLNGSDAFKIAENDAEPCMLGPKVHGCVSILAIMTRLTRAAGGNLDGTPSKPATAGRHPAVPRTLGPERGTRIRSFH